MSTEQPTSNVITGRFDHARLNAYAKEAMHILDKIKWGALGAVTLVGGGAAVDMFNEAAHKATPAECPDGREITIKDFRWYGVEVTISNDKGGVDRVYKGIDSVDAGKAAKNACGGLMKFGIAY